MIYDCFSFYNELDLLEIRLNVLKDVVDKFVLVEGTCTHTGAPKPLYYNENKARFADFADKIVHIIVDDYPDPPPGYSSRDASWMREDWQRNAIVRGLKEARSDDLILVSDVDEIPAPKAVLAAKGKKGVTAFEQLLTNYYINFVSFTTPIWVGTKAADLATFLDEKTYAKMGKSKYVDEFTNRGATASRLRHVRAHHRIRRAGWHFSYLGGAAAIVSKIGSIAQEYRNEHNTSEQWVEEVIAKGLDVCGCGRRFFAVPLDERFPLYLRENCARYQALILRPEPDYWRKTRVSRCSAVLRGWIRRYGAKLIPRPFKQVLFDRVYCKLVKEPIVC